MYPNNRTCRISIGCIRSYGIRIFSAFTFIATSISAHHIFHRICKQFYHYIYNYMNNYCHHHFPIISTSYFTEVLILVKCNLFEWCTSNPSVIVISKYADSVAPNTTTGYSTCSVWIQLHHTQIRSTLCFLVRTYDLLRAAILLRKSKLLLSKLFAQSGLRHFSENTNRKGTFRYNEIISWTPDIIKYFQLRSLHSIKWTKMKKMDLTLWSDSNQNKTKTKATNIARNNCWYIKIYDNNN